MQVRTGTIVGLTILSGAWLALAGPPPACGGEASSTPDLSGTWKLIPEQSDDGQPAADVFLPFGHRRRGPGGVGPGDDDGFGGAPPEGNRPDGPPGGSWGGRGAGRGPRGGGPPGGHKRRSPEEMRAIRTAVMASLVGTPSLEITQTDREITLESAQGEGRTLRSDGKKKKEHGVSQKARWKDGRLVIETKADLFKIKEAYALDAAQGLLRVEITAERRRFGGEVHLKRVYRRMAGPVEVD
jgi:hypothetical protein